MFRREEVYITYSTFIRFMQEDSTLEFDTIDSSTYDRKSWTSTNDGLPLVKYDSDVSLTGHSFGGCTVVSPNPCLCRRLVVLIFFVAFVTVE